MIEETVEFKIDDGMHRLWINVAVATTRTFEAGSPLEIDRLAHDLAVDLSVEHGAQVRWSCVGVAHYVWGEEHAS